MEQKLKTVLAALLAAGPLALSVALAPPANAAVKPDSAQQDVQDVAARLAGVQKVVAEIAGQSPETTPATPNTRLAWWVNGPRVGWFNGGWRNGGWRNWRNGWFNGWRNGGWRNF
jgi:rSAM-associated Gly-rich repeat protein